MSAATAESVHVWTAAGWVPDRSADADREPWIIDSWLVESGRVRRLDRHLSRFWGSLVVAGLAPADLRRALNSVPALLPRSGRWFPRLEAARPGTEQDGLPGELRLRLRPAPAQGGPLTVATAPDPRRWPDTKGPDLPALARVHREGVERGAGEVLLEGDEGQLSEGTRTTLLWWEGDTLRRIPVVPPRLPGVTETVLMAVAADRGIEIGTAPATLEDLRGRETWLVNALHGIRPVREWVGPEPIQVGAPRRAAAWQRAWRSAATPLPPRGRGPFGPVN